MVQTESINLGKHLLHNPSQKNLTRFYIALNNDTGNGIHITFVPNMFR